MIQKVWIKDFRNINECVIECNKTPLFIYGENNQGKTNFLESIFVLQTGTSPIQSPIQDMVAFGKKEALLGIDFLDDGKKQRAYMTLTREGKKKIFLNNTKLGSIRSIKNRLSVEFISADIIRFFQENPEYRRKNLDQFCSAFFDDYPKELKQLDTALRQKNAAFKKGMFDQVPLWNEKITEIAVKIIEKRHKALDLIVSMLCKFTKEILGNELSDISITYECKHLMPFSTPKAYTLELSDYFKKNSEKEKILGYSLAGPQRDDIHIYINKKSCYSIYSRGINRTVALLLKGAQLSIIKEKKGYFPVLLLDEVFAELDCPKKKVLIPFLVEKAQCIFASIQESDSQFFNGVSLYSMTNGTLRNV